MYSGIRLLLPTVLSPFLSSQISVNRMERGEFNGMRDTSKNIPGPNFGDGLKRGNDRWNHKFSSLVTVVRGEARSFGVSKVGRVSVFWISLLTVIVLHNLCMKVDVLEFVDSFLPS